MKKLILLASAALFFYATPTEAQTRKAANKKATTNVNRYPPKSAQNNRGFREAPKSAQEKQQMNKMSAAPARSK